MSLPVVVIVAIAIVLCALLAFDTLAPARATTAALWLERRRAGVRCASVQLTNYQMRYWRGGQGEPLLLLHGFAADKDNFVRVAAHLTRHFDVIAPDLTGFGDSDRLDTADFSFASQAERLHAFVAALGLPPFHLGGSSMGGAIAVVYAGQHPQQVRSLWLLAPAGVDGAEDSEMAIEYRSSGRSLLVARQPADFRQVLQLTMTRQPFLPLCVRRTLAARAVADAPLHVRIFDQIATGPGISDVATGVAVPARIVWGVDDRVLDVSGADLLQAQLPNASTLKLQTTGHLPMVERPKVVARDFIHFVGTQRAETGVH